MRNLKKFFFVPVLAFSLLVGGGAVVNAQVDLDSGLDTVAGEAGLEGSDPEQTLGQLINVALGLLGIIFLLLVLYAGFLWMTAGGNSDQIDKAKKLMINGVVGLIIILAAYAISNFVIDALGEAGLSS